MQEHPKQVLDVRRFAEFNAGHLPMAVNQPLDYLLPALEGLDKSQGYYVHCKGGYRSMIAISIMMARGFLGIVDVQGGWDALSHTALAMRGQAV